MIFWAAAAGLAALTAWLVLVRGARQRADSGGPPADSATAFYRRQVLEIDELTDTGMLTSSDRSSALAEAARRLLLARRQVRPAASPSALSRRLLVGAVAVTAVAALAVYWAAGHPGLADQPYADRLESWREADPQRLAPAQMAALLANVARERPDDPRLLGLLGRVRLAAGDYPAAAESFRKAIRLDPGDAVTHRLLGEALVQGAAGSAAPPEAEAAFRRALELDPKDPASHFFLGEAAFDRGDLEQARQEWQAAQALLPAADPRRAVLDQRLAEAEQLAQSAPASEAIEGMVSGLAERLSQNPDDPEGWARLVRSYGVLGRREAQMRALEAARRALAGQPEALARVEAEAPPPAPQTSPR